MRRRVAPLALVLSVLAVAACGSESVSAPPPGLGPAAQSGTPLRANWPTYHRDNTRAGYDPSTPRARGLGRAWTSPRLDGRMYASPLIVGSRVIVATQRNTVYALDARSGRIVWSRHLGAPVDGSTLPCGNINPSGITSTPVADPRAGVVYVVAFLRPLRHELAVLDLRTGAVRARRSADARGLDPRVHQQRGALALANGRVYVPYGGLFGDCGNYHGWVVGLPAVNGRPAVAYRVPSSREAGIWAPSGPAVDRRGRLFVVTGNAASTSRFDHGNSVIRLSAELRKEDLFTPRESPQLNAGDIDLGSVGPLLLSQGRLLVAGKSGIAYALSTERLGGVGGALASRRVCNSVGVAEGAEGGAFGGLAAHGDTAYVPCTNGIVAVRVGDRRLDVQWRGPRFRAGPPIVAGGLVWSLDLDTGRLYGLDGLGRTRARADVGPVAQFATPAAAEGLITVAGADRVVALRTR